MDTRAVMIAATALVLLTSCERLVVDARGVAAPNPGGAGATAAECTAVDVALSTIPSQATGEPSERKARSHAGASIHALSSR